MKRSIVYWTVNTPESRVLISSVGRKALWLRLKIKFRLCFMDCVTLGRDKVSVLWFTVMFARYLECRIKDTSGTSESSVIQADFNLHNG